MLRTAERPCTEAGGEWLHATVTSSPSAGGSRVGISLALFRDSGEHSQLADHLSDSLMLPQTLGFLRARLSCSLPTEPGGTSVDAVEQDECLLVTIRPLAWLVRCLV